MKVVIALYVSAIVPSTSARSGVLPASCSAPGKMQSSPADEFFSACLSNPNTRRAYDHPVGRFLTWCDLAHTSGTTL